MSGDERILSCWSHVDDSHRGPFSASPFKTSMKDELQNDVKSNLLLENYSLEVHKGSVKAECWNFWFTTTAKNCDRQWCNNENDFEALIITFYLLEVFEESFGALAQCAVHHYASVNFLFLFKTCPTHDQEKVQIRRSIVRNVRKRRNKSRSQWKAWAEVKI